MCVPLISKAEIRGVIYVDSLQKPYGFRREDLSLLTALSSPAAIAIENALLHERLEKVKRDEDKM
jgi:GAF domain-containing protein